MTCTDIYIYIYLLYRIRNDVVTFVAFFSCTVGTTWKYTNRKRIKNIIVSVRRLDGPFRTCAATSKPFHCSLVNAHPGVASFCPLFRIFSPGPRQRRLTVNSATSARTVSGGIFLARHTASARHNAQQKRGGNGHFRRPREKQKSETVRSHEIYRCRRVTSRSDDYVYTAV